MTFILKQLDKTPNLCISQKVINEIFYLHQQYGNNEWSGILWGDVEGSITDINNLKITALDFSLLDLGEPAFTSFDLNTNVIDIYLEKPQLMSKKIMTLHTHHSMKCFFSGTDMKQLEEQSPYHNYYVSVIVNKDCNIIAKLSFIGKEKNTQLSYKDDNGKLITFNDSVEKDILFVCDFNVYMESDNKQKLEMLKLEKQQNNQLQRLNNLTTSNINYQSQLDLFPAYTSPVKIKKELTEEYFLISILSYGSESIADSIKDINDELQMLSKKDILNRIKEDIEDEILNYFDKTSSRLEKLDFYTNCCKLLDKYSFNIKNEVLNAIKTKINE